MCECVYTMKFLPRNYDADYYYTDEYGVVSLYTAQEVLYNRDSIACARARWIFENLINCRRESSIERRGLRLI